MLTIYLQFLRNICHRSLSLSKLPSKQTLGKSDLSTGAIIDSPFHSSVSQTTNLPIQFFFAVFVQKLRFIIHDSKIRPVQCSIFFHSKISSYRLFALHCDRRGIGNRDFSPFKLSSSSFSSSSKNPLDAWKKSSFCFLSSSPSRLENSFSRSTQASMFLLDFSSVSSFVSPTIC